MDTGNGGSEMELLGLRESYLWDGSGDPDPEILRLEALLGRFRYRDHAPAFPEIVPDRRRMLSLRRVRLFPLLGIAAVAVLAITVFIFLRHGSKPISVVGWEMSRVTGQPRIGPNTVRDSETSHLGPGQTLETDYRSRVRLRAEDIGQIEVEPSTRLRVMALHNGLKGIALDRGTIHTYIWATPGQFVVDTPSAIAVDLGCAYTLRVDDSGAGLVRTSLGWVGFTLKGRESFIPAGAACATRPRTGPGTPYFEDASSEFRAALARFDFEDRTPEQRSRDLGIVLNASRKRDALTLWHLLTRADEAQRVLVFNRLRERVPPPSGVSQEAILRLDQPTLDQWWNELGFDDISVWRRWERSWSRASTPTYKR